MAVGVLQVTASGKMSLVPVAILINGKFWDASAYKANPVPMALETGTVYEAERTGSSQGLFTVGSALHSTATNAPMPWIGTGAWDAGGAEKANAPVKAEGAPKGIDSGDDRPRLTRNPQGVVASTSSAPPQTGSPQSTQQTSSPPSSSPQSGSSQSSSAQTSAPSSSGDEPPRLKRPADGTNSGASGQGSAQSGAPQTGSPPAESSQTGSAQAGAGAPASKSGDTGSSAERSSAGNSAPAKPPESDSGAAEGNRPRLRRGKPTQSFADEDFPGYSKLGATQAKTAKAAAEAGPVQLIPAISDAAGPIPHTFTYHWLKDEEGERRQQITDLAKQQLQAYLAAQAKLTIAPKPAAQARHAKAVKAPEPILSNVKMTTYDLWTNNQPVIVFSADAQMPPTETPGTGFADVQYSIMLVARSDIYNNLRPLYSGITDKFHLDLTPRLELVDAVDADGDGRGELLFRQTTDAGTGWVIYRATADKLWKMYDSQNPE